jgi:hypothetical protein
MKLRSLVPNTYIHVSVSDIYIPRIGLPIWPILVIYIYNRSQHRYMNVENWETEHYDSVLEIRAAQFHFWKYINRNQTFILDSHRSFMCCTLPFFEAVR